MNQGKIMADCVRTNFDESVPTYSHIHWKVWLGLFLALANFGVARGKAQSRPNDADLHGQIIDENGLPVARVEIVPHSGGDSSRTVYSDAAGRFELPGLPESQIHLTISKPGFFRLDDRVVDLSAGSNEVSITLNHE